MKLQIIPACFFKVSIPIQKYAYGSKIAQIFKKYTHCSKLHKLFEISQIVPNRINC